MVFIPKLFKLLKKN